MLSSMERMLDVGGVLIAGFNHMLGSSARYMIYRKTINGLTPRQFAFSLDNLKPLVVASWYTRGATTW